jgi:hypothetical protein
MSISADIHKNNTDPGGRSKRRTDSARVSYKYYSCFFTLSARVLVVP